MSHDTFYLKKKVSLGLIMIGGISIQLILVKKLKKKIETFVDNFKHCEQG